jgi:hypothetical protein
MKLFPDGPNILFSGSCTFFHGLPREESCMGRTSGPSPPVVHAGTTVGDCDADSLEGDDAGAHGRDDSATPASEDAGSVASVDWNYAANRGGGRRRGDRDAPRKGGSSFQLAFSVLTRERKPGHQPTGSSSFRPGSWVAKPIEHVGQPARYRSVR